jgi:hypothetical protein
MAWASAENKRRGRYRLAVATTVGLGFVFVQLMLMAPGIGIAFGVVAAPLVVYMLRITRQYLENESSWRRRMADTGTVVLAVLGAWLFICVTVATLFWIICMGGPR